MGRHEGLRSRAAKLAAAGHALKCRSGSEPAFSLAFLTDAARVANPLLVARVLPHGSAVILRDYETPGRARLAVQLKAICAARGVRLIVGADPALAKRIGADGVHLPRWFEPQGPAPENLIVTAACHDRESLQRAAARGADLALLSPAFPTKSHRDAVALGADRFRALAADADLPVLALGGVDEKNAQTLMGRNVAGLAAIGAFLG